jgi:Flp pilus assembly protein TadG
MLLPHLHRAPRQGAIAPLAGFLLIVLVGMVAFAVDIGWIVAARTELQSAADAAALAGADPLMDYYVQYETAGLNSVTALTRSTIISNAMAASRTKAKSFASSNSAGSVSNLTLMDSDIEFGYTDPTGAYTVYSSGQPFPNTIKVTLRRDSNANGALGLFFAPAIGDSSTNLKATASAVITAGTLSNFTIPPGMLPATYDVNRWKQFVSTGQQPDGTINISTYDQQPQLQVYPSIQDVGNFGQLSLNDSHVGDSYEEGWMANGMSSSDLSALQSANLIPLSEHPANTWDWTGDTGFKSSLVQTVNQYNVSSYPNQTYLLPLFTPYNSSSTNYQAGVSQGSSYMYDIVQFVGIKIMPGGGNSQIIVQPAAVIPPGAVFTSVSTVDTSQTGNFITVFSYPRLSQ